MLLYILLLYSLFALLCCIGGLALGLLVMVVPGWLVFRSDLLVLGG